jgi:hypothetical protein
MHLFISSFFGKKEERNEELNEKELLKKNKKLSAKRHGGVKINKIYSNKSHSRRCMSAPAPKDPKNAEKRKSNVFSALSDLCFQKYTQSYRT